MTKPPPPPALLHIWNQIAERVWREIPNYSRGQFSSVQFNCSVMCNSLRSHGLQHTRPTCPSPTPGACSNSCPLSWWCHLTISSSVVPFSSCLQSFPASGYFPMSQFFISGAQLLWLHRSFSFIVSPSNEYSEWISFRIDRLVSLQSKRLSRV